MKDLVEVALQETDFSPVLTHFKRPIHFYQYQDEYISYRIHNRTAVMMGPPIGTNKFDIFCKFKKEMNSCGLPVCGYYSKKLNLKGISFFNCGTESVVKKENWSLKGEQARDVRRALNLESKFGFAFEEMEVCPKNLKCIKTLERQWKQRWRGPQIGFILSEVQMSSRTHLFERWFGVFSQGELIAFASVLPNGKGYYMNHFFFDPEGPKMSNDFLIAKALQSVLGEDGVQEVSMGFNAYDVSERNSLLEKGLSRIYNLKWPYNARGIRQFKRKFMTTEQNQYLYLDNNFLKPKQILSLFRATYSRSVT